MIKVLRTAVAVPVVFVRGCKAPRRGWLGLTALILALTSWPAQADESWTDGRQFGLESAAAGNAVPSPMGDQVVAALTPGSVLIAQAGGGTEPPAEGWRFSVAPYFWMARTKASLDVRSFSRLTTIKFTDVVPDLHMAFAAHAEATYREWTGFLDLFYISMGQSETQNGISVSTNTQQLFFEFGGTYRLPALSLGKAGRLTFEPLAGGRFMWLEGSLGFPNRKVSDSGSVIDPMVGGRIVWLVTDTVALWFRGDAAGFGISDSQSALTYNLIGGIEWRFHPKASAMVGFRYLNIDLEKDHRVGTFDANIEMYGPFLGLNIPF